MSLNATGGVSERAVDKVTHNNTDNSTDTQADHNIYSNDWNSTVGLEVTIIFIIDSSLLFFSYWIIL